MKHLRSILQIAVFLLLSNLSYSQVQTARHLSMTPNSQGFYEYLPQGYNPASSETYPVIIFVHGIGELGDGSPSQLPKMLWAGIPATINGGQFPTSVTVNGQTHKFIVLSPQFISWPTGGDIENVINYAIANYRVNTQRIYLTGLSMGGGVVWEYAGASTQWASRLAALIPICGASWPDWNRSRNINTANLPVWAIHNNDDPTCPVFYTNDYVSFINQSPAPAVPAKKTINPYGGHDAWTNAYNGNTQDGGMNIYQWMLQYQKGAPAPAPNLAPVANAGPNQVLSSSATSAQLSGTASDPDGTIASYSWTKVSGPASFSFNSTGIPNPVVSNLSKGQYVFKMTVTDNKGATASSNVSVSIPVTLPGKIEAENYVAMSGIQTENTADAGGGANVGWQDNNDWLDYAVEVSAAGTYTVNFRVATLFSGAQFQLRKSDGTVLTTVTVPNTGGFQNWQTVAAQVTLASGPQTLRIVTTNANGGWNFNWWEVAGAAPAPGPVPSTPSGSNTKIEAESYTTMAGVQTEPTADAGGGLNVGWQDNNDWMDYGVNIPTAGTYTLNFRVATIFNGPQFQLRSSTGAVLATVTVPNTGGFQNWQTVSAQVTLAAGAQTLRIVTSNANGGWNFNWWEVPGTTTTTTSPDPTPTPTPTPTSSIKIQAESYTNMAGIQTEPTSDAGGGLNVGWQDNNDWMDYSVNLSSAGTYTVNFRVATIFTGAQFQLRSSTGTVLTTVTVPFTGGFQNWQTVSAQVNLPAGAQTFRIVTTNAAGGWNFNWWEILGSSSTTTTTPPPVTSTRIEAETYTTMAGIQTEPTADAGGGLNVGWQDNNDWMDYSVNPATTGTYTVKFRVATLFNGPQFQLRTSSGTVLTTVTVPNTGGFQNWQTVSAQVNLTAGPQTLRIVTTNAAGGWNINWWEITTGTATTSQTTSTTTEEVVSTSAGIEIFPNPVTDKMVLTVNNELQGAVIVDVINMQGAVVKSVNLNKQTGSSQFYISAGDLQAGQYIVRVTMTGWTQTKMIVKQ